jgi:hypothetical protein
MHHYTDVLGMNSLIAIGFASVGAVIVPRSSPRNPTGWLFGAIGFLWAVMHFSAQYAIYTRLAVPGLFPASKAAAWMMCWVWVPASGLIVFLCLLFPDGRLPSRRWRWFASLSLLLILAGAISQALAPGSVYYLRDIYNPYGVEGLPNVGNLVQMVVFTLIFVSAVSLFVRRLRASGVERQQLKWFTFSSTLAISGVILTYTISDAIGALWLEWVGYLVLVVGFIGIPISMAIAVLRYRLYDLDILINRTLVYGSLTAILAALYFGAIVLLQRIFVALTGEKSTLAVVASTLVIATSLQPAAPAGAGVRRSALLQEEVRCRKDPGGLLRQAQGRDGPGGIERRPGGGGEGDDAARARLLVAAPRNGLQGPTGRLATYVFVRRDVLW